jgi:hypothetical protein
VLPLLEDPMTERDDDRANEGPAERRAPSRLEDASHHLVVNDGELLDIGPNAETVDDVAGQAHDRRGVRWPGRGRRATDREPDRDRG